MSVPAPVVSCYAPGGLGLPLVLFPRGVNRMAVLVVLPSNIMNTWPNYQSRCWRISCTCCISVFSSICLCWWSGWASISCILSSRTHCGRTTGSSCFSCSLANIQIHRGGLSYCCSLTKECCTSLAQPGIDVFLCCIVSALIGRIRDMRTLPLPPGLLLGL